MRKTTAKKESKRSETELLMPTLGQLKKAAYYRWLDRGMPEGESLEDWYEVENKWRDNIVPSRND